MFVDVAIIHMVIESFGSHTKLLEGQWVVMVGGRRGRIEKDMKGDEKRILKSEET